jgi:non-lysosomal glucosylceramidase
LDAAHVPLDRRQFCGYLPISTRTRQEYASQPNKDALPMSAGIVVAADPRTAIDRWPVLTSYEGEKLARVALPIGGIGTGTVSLGGRGDLHDWEIVNRPAKGFTPDKAFFVVRSASADGTHLRCLEGPLSPQTHEGPFGEISPHAGLPRFASATFHAAYPFGQVELHDDDIPLSVRLEAFNPLIPGDSDRSGIPIAELRYVVENSGTVPADVSIAGVLENFVGRDGFRGKSIDNINERRSGDGITGVFMHSNGVASDAEQWGSIALSVLDDDLRVSTRESWADLNWGDTLLDFWDDFEADGELDPRDRGKVHAPVASVCAKATLAPAEERTFTFLLTWHFPNRQSWHSDTPDAVRVGNYYATQYDDAWEVAVRTCALLGALERDTVDFVTSFCSSPLPNVVKEAALYNVSTLRTQTSFRIEDGTILGWEGCNDHWGSCHGSCTHVWNYEQATAFLFGDLARSMRDVEFLSSTRPDGRMSFRSELPLSRATDWPTAAADGQMGCIMKLYRDWQLHGDESWLAKRWPSARRALEFAWVEGGWDADQDGVMEGCQHNTMDVEYFGPNPQMGFWYLGALRASEEMACHLGDDLFAERCRALFLSGSAWIDANLFNGEYYEHEIRPIRNPNAIAPGLRHIVDHNPDLGATDLSNPDFQIGAGCLVDQLVGQYMAHVCGLGYLGDPAKIRTALASDFTYNFKPTLRSHFNHLRTFALGDEAAMLMASYPFGRRPTRPFPYFNEVMTGFEYTAAVHMLYEGDTVHGLEVIDAIRARYDGERRSPFNEAECGHHYARAMASWAAVLAMTGFHYSAVRREMRFGTLPSGSRTFWSTGDAWGILANSADGYSLECHQGIVRVDTLLIDGNPVNFGITEPANP